MLSVNTAKCLRTPSLKNICERLLLKLTLLIPNHENCPRGKLLPTPQPNSNANRKPNPDPDRGAIFLGGNFPDTKKRYHKISLLRKFIKYKFSIRYLYFWTLVLALNCGGNVKHGLLSNKATIWQLKESQSSDKLLGKMFSSNHME